MGSDQSVDEVGGDWGLGGEERVLRVQRNRAVDTPLTSENTLALAFCFTDQNVSP